MTYAIDEAHLLVDLATLEEVRGAIIVDDGGLATIRTREPDGTETTGTRQLPLDGWRLVRRR